MTKPLFYLISLVLFVLAAMSAHAEDGPFAIKAAPVPLNTEDAAVTGAGRLRYMGGLHLSSGEERFGGISGLRLLGGNRFLAVTDQGDWLRLDVVEGADGRLTGIGPARIGRLTDERGAPLIAEALVDAEALTVSRKDGKPVRATVYFERSHRGERFDLGPDGEFIGASTLVPLGAWTQELPNNEGLEAVAGLPGSRLLIAEGARGSDGRIKARRAITTDGETRFQPVFFDLPAPYKPTDAHALTDGSVILLSRHYAPMDGVWFRLDRLALTDGGALRRTGIAELKAPYTVDNMEGLAVREEDGRTFLYVVSDDNFRPTQRTLLLKFELVRTAEPQPPQN